MKASKIQWFPIVTISLYTWLGVVALINHEPWRDEAQAWLIARDLDLLGIFKQMSYEGHLALWHMLLFPFAQTGSSYLVEFIIHLGIAIFAAAVFVRHAPFSKTTKVLFIFSYYMAYEYSIIARNYNISILLLFLLAACYEDRFKNPRRYSLLIFFLFNTNVHSMPIAGSLTILFGMEFLKNNAQNPKALLSIFVMGLGFVLAVVQLMPSPDHMFYGFIFKPLYLTSALQEAFFVTSSPREIYAFLGFVIFSFILLSLVEKPAVLFIALASCLGLFCIFVFKYPGSLRHHGLILIILIFSLWISKYYPRIDPNILADKSNKVTSALGKIDLSFFLLNSCLLISVIFCMKMHLAEYTFCFSGAKETARFIAKNNPDSYIIVAHYSPQASALLPYLPGRKFWYANTKKYGTYVTWDKNYSNNMGIDNAEVIARMREAFPNHSNLLLLLSRPLYSPEVDDFTLLYETDCTVFGYGKERYYLYKQNDKSNLHF